MEDLKLIKTGEFLKVDKDPWGTGTLVSLFKDDSLEINKYIFQKGKKISLRRPKNNDGTKSYYIIEGKLKSLEDGQEYDKGSLILLDYRYEKAHFEVIEDSQVVVHAYKEESYKDVVENNKKVYEATKVT